MITTDTTAAEARLQLAHRQLETVCKNNDLLASLQKRSKETLTLLQTDCAEQIGHDFEFVGAAHSIEQDNVVSHSYHMTLRVQEHHVCRVCGAYARLDVSNQYSADHRNALSKGETMLEEHKQRVLRAPSKHHPYRNIAYGLGNEVCEGGLVMQRRCYQVFSARVDAQKKLDEFGSSRQ